MIPSAEELVARFLRSNGYDETLANFIKEAGLPPDTGSSSASQVTIQQILDEKKAFDLSLNFEKLGVDDPRFGWRSPAPSNPIILDVLPTSSNILSVHVLDLMLPGAAGIKRCIAATTADRRLNLVEHTSSSFSLLKSYTHFHDAPILDLVVINRKYLLTASMSGRLLLYNTETDEVVDQRKDHSKYIVKLATWSEGGSTIIASAGWDSKVNLYRLEFTSNVLRKIGEPIATLTVPRIPEAILFIPSAGDLMPILLVTQRDSTFLYYYSLPSPTAESSAITLLGRQNLAPQSNAWVAFSPSDVQLCPSDPSLIAVSTSSTPHMKLLLVRLLVPPSGSTSSADPLRLSNDANTVLAPPAISAPDSQASQARASHLVQVREEAAILLSINTLAPQTAYSTPRLAWRPDGSGVYVSSDDGIIRAFEASTGKLISTLRGHDEGVKIRCLWAGGSQSDSTMTSEGKDSHEWLISGGFDQQLLVWTEKH
ncbi:WD40-repeat-containing domain protein [Clohesyomyces aquaticus]|uniref:WD40-repeat-containing domain protein n=1 Tax=Clohesyomyces aquaticus TaxID=1231657 RepID=A0A1Y1YKQ1_9PLEO|nr:WD40-repeat-containing domain protein [Clohesyomyces aquaticus]